MTFGDLRGALAGMSAEFDDLVIGDMQLLVDGDESMNDRRLRFAATISQACAKYVPMQSQVIRYDLIIAAARACPIEYTDAWESDEAVKRLSGLLKGHGFVNAAAAVLAGIAWVHSVASITNDAHMREIEKTASEPGWSWTSPD
jgi:hypothetical protein